MTATDTHSSQKTVWVCQYQTCRKQGSAEVLAAFQAESIPNVVVKAVSCMGQCGNGPMVRVLPDDIWYWQVCAAEVPAIIERHLVGGQPIAAMIYPYAPIEFSRKKSED